CDDIGQGELVAPEEIDVTPGYRREAGDIGGEWRRSGLAELSQGFLHVDGVPMYNGVEGQSEGSELLFLALTQGASDFAALAVMDAPAELVAQFLPVELEQDPSPERAVIDVSQDVQRLDDASEFRQGLGQRCRAVFDLQHSHDTADLARQLVLEGKSISAVARTFNVHPATIYRCLEPND